AAIQTAVLPSANVPSRSMQMALSSRQAAPTTITSPSFASILINTTGPNAQSRRGRDARSCAGGPLWPPPRDVRRGCACRGRPRRAAPTDICYYSMIGRAQASLGVVMRESSVKSRDRRPFLWVTAGALAPLFIVGFGITKLTGWFSSSQVNNTTISHSVVVEKVQKVAKLVSSETNVRDVLTFEDTWYGSTKRSLVVVTGTVQAGINLGEGTSVEIDENAKRIAIVLPQPGVLGIGITD